MAVMAFFVGTASADLIFGVSFDSSVGADVAAGDATGYSYATDHGSSDALATRAITTNAAKFGAASLDCDTAARHLAYRTTNNVNWTTGTLDMFVRISSTGFKYVTQMGETGGLDVYVSADLSGATDRLYVYWNGVSYTADADFLTLDQFSHIAITWDMSGGAGNGVVKGYANGTLLINETGLNPAVPTDPTMWFGAHYSSGSGGSGNIDDIAIYDTIEYTGNFTPRTASAIPPQPSPIFVAGFDSDVEADVAAGDATGYKYATDHANPDTPATRTTTTAASKFGAGSLDCVAAAFLAYRTTNNVNWTTGTLDMFMRISSTGYKHVFYVGETGGLDMQVNQDFSGTTDRFYLSWNGTGYTADANFSTIGEFSHIAISWDMSGGAGNGVVKAFANGDLLIYQTGLDPAAPTDPTMWFGAHYSTGGGQIDGYIDDIAIYDTVVYYNDFTSRTTTLVPPPQGTCVIIK